MKIEPFITVKEIGKMKIILSDQGDSIGYSEICYGKMLILQGNIGGNCLFLDEVPLIELFYEIQYFLSPNKVVPKIEGAVADANQAYRISLIKNEKILTLRTSSRDEQCEVEFDYSKFLHRWNYVSKRFLEDLQSSFPESEFHSWFDKLRDVFYFDVPRKLS